jgi:FKBP-type peptidyl-prolyl cis-trans isomerase 2
MSQVKKDDTVKVHYTGKLKDGQVFDSSVERDEPIEFKVGDGKIIPGFENGIIDMKVNEKKTIEIAKEDAYGEVHDELYQEIPKDQLPDEVEPAEGMGLVAKNPDGSERELRINAVKDESIIVDANHPLAGKDLNFEVEVLEIK